MFVNKIIINVDQFILLSSRYWRQRNTLKVASLLELLVRYNKINMYLLLVYVYLTYGWYYLNRQGKHLRWGKRLPMNCFLGMSNLFSRDYILRMNEITHYVMPYGNVLVYWLFVYFITNVDQFILLSSRWWRQPDPTKKCKRSQNTGKK